MARTFSRLILFVFATLLLGPLWGQSQTAQVSGSVERGAGPLTLTSESTGARRMVRPRADGTYTIASLEPGVYILEAGMPSQPRRIVLHAGERLREDFDATFSIRRLFTGQEIRALPSLSRNPFEFAALAGNVSDAGTATRGVGVASNGQRESSTFVLLDGAAQMNEFAGSVGQPIPLEAIEEFTIVTEGFPAELGRASGAIVNAVTKSGAEDLHGSVFDFNRLSRLSSASFRDNANGIRQPAFTRNQFGFSAGGALRRNRLFIFNSSEATLIRSRATQFAWIPSAAFLARTAPNTQTFFQTLGQLRPDAAIVGGVTLGALTASFGRNPCTGLPCATLPATLQLFDRVTWNAPADSGGGAPQNTWNTFTRADYNLSNHTWLYARYSLYSEDDAAGVLATSPYDNYDLRQREYNNSILAALEHEWNASRVSRTSLSFSRLNIFQQGLTSRGIVPSMYANPLSPVAIGSDSIVFPGYNPLTPGAGAFGGPQNTAEVNHDTSWVRGRHSLRFGGSWRYLRDNRTSAAYQTAVDSLSNGGGIGPAVNGLLSGRFAHVQVAIDPRATGFATPPDFTRGNRFNDAALYVQDEWAVRRGLSISAGLRWERYGNQHNGNAALDSNWYAPNVGFADSSLAAYLRNGMLQPVAQSSLGKLWEPEWKDFAPRAGFAWDVFGNSRTTLRGSYGIAYERNFGNVTFNVIQNLPNYAVVDVAGPIAASNYGSLSAAAGSALQRSGARIIDPHIRTAYAHLWGASADREIRRGVVYSLQYSGSKGVDLYSISYPNQAGFGNAELKDPCAGTGDCRSQPNPAYTEDVGYRGNQGFSSYHGLNNKVAVQNLLHGSLSFVANYTWSHAIDNLSSTFFEAGGQGVAGLFGRQNVTINNGNFDRGLLDPYHPDLDRGDAEFDARHRVTLSGVWRVPAYRKSGWLGTISRGWGLSPIFTARSGQPFSVFDSSAQTLDLNTPRATFIQPVPKGRNTFVASTTPDTFHILTFLPAQLASEPNPLTPGSLFPANMSRRDAFRAPGFWNLNMGAFKDTRLTDRMTLQLRGEAFNLLNHANLYVIGASADVGTANTVDACFGCSGSVSDRRQIQLAARLLF